MSRKMQPIGKQIAKSKSSLSPEHSDSSGDSYDEEAAKKQVKSLVEAKSAAIKPSNFYATNSIAKAAVTSSFKIPKLVSILLAVITQKFDE